MIYEYEGHTYTAQGLHRILKADYRDRGLKVWNLASLDEMIAHTAEYGLSEVTPLRKGKHKAERHTTVVVIPYEAQLIKLWELDVPLENCIFNNDNLIAFYQHGFRMIKYVIDKNGNVSTAVYDMARGERKQLRRENV